MEDEKLFQIGEVAKMFHISMGTLRHYEQYGLLKPERTDPKTGYRYYSVRQLEMLNTIRYLRVLDIPLAQIAEFLQNRDIHVIEEKLVKQKEIIQQKQQELERISRKIDHRLEQLREATSAELDKISMVQTPPSRIVLIRDLLKLESYLDLEYSIRRMEAGQKESLAFLGKVGVGISKESLEAGVLEHYELAFLLLDEEDAYEGNVETFPAAACVMIRFRGSHTEAPRYYQKLLRYIRENGLCVAGFSREITLIDYGFTKDTEKFVTEIRIPVTGSSEETETP